MRSVFGLCGFEQLRSNENPSQKQEESERYSELKLRNVSFGFLPCLRAYSFQHSGLFAFELPITCLVFLTEIDGELQVASVNASIAANGPRAETEKAFPNGSVAKFEIDFRTVRIVKGAPNE